MTRAVAIATGVLVALAATGPAAAARAGEVRTPAQATIVESTGVRVNWPMAMPSVQGGVSGASFIGSMPSMGMAMMLMPRGSGLMVRREDSTGAPITAPASFAVVGDQGSETLILKTGGGSEIRIPGDGAIVGGSLIGGSAASIAVDRGVAMSVSEGARQPVSRDTLVVVVQYN